MKTKKGISLTTFGIISTSVAVHINIAYEEQKRVFLNLKRGFIFFSR